VVPDAGYSAAALAAGLAGYPVHLLARLPARSAFFAGAARWPGKNGRPATHGAAVHCQPGTPNPEPGETLLLPGTPLHGDVRVHAWRGVHPQIHGDRGWFKDNWHGRLPVLRGTLPHVTVDHLPDGRAPRKAMWLWHAGPAPAVPRRAVARLPGPLLMKSTPLNSPRVLSA
jgi:hypothetical protein